MRKKIVAGNWKMNLNVNEGLELAKSLNDIIASNKASDVDVIICPPFTHLYSISQLTDNQLIKTGAQNCSQYNSGAYTGEISVEMIKSAGAEYVLIGHSERRSYYGEDDVMLAKKVKTALDGKLRVIYCIGESLEQRESAKHFDIVNEQLKVGVFALEPDLFSKITIAYEPVWAIGTGVTASSAQAQEMHKFIRNTILKNFNQQIATQTSILYGGSCNATNAKELFSMPDVDGGLIGGAALKANDFSSIISSF